MRTRNEPFLHQIRKRVKSLLLVRQFGPEQSVVFEHDGEHKLDVPRTRIMQRFANNGLEVWRKQQFSQRPHHEALLRRIVHCLFERSVLSRRRSVIDIGCWIGDNAIVWAKALEKSAVVHAVDPSPENILFAQSIAAFNNLDNIRWYQEVCSDSAGQIVGFRGNLDHASFFVTGSDAAGLRTTTLDNLIDSEEVKNIGLLHVDVEGFELSVLRGSKQILVGSRPIVLFEGHLRDSKGILQIRSYLKEFGFCTFMINEVLPGCDLDCRNFLSVEESRVSAVMGAVTSLNSTAKSIFPATLGPLLLPLELSR